MNLENSYASLPEGFHAKVEPAVAAAPSMLAWNNDLAVGFCLLLPGYQMHSAWAPMLPGFEWLTPIGFVFGLVGSYLYGWFIAIIWVPLYGTFDRRFQSEE